MTCICSCDNPIGRYALDYVRVRSTDTAHHSFRRQKRRRRACQDFLMSAELQVEPEPQPLSTLPCLPLLICAHDRAHVHHLPSPPSHPHSIVNQRAFIKMPKKQVERSLPERHNQLLEPEFTPPSKLRQGLQSTRSQCDTRRLQPHSRDPRRAPAAGLDRPAREARRWRAVA